LESIGEVEGGSSRRSSRSDSLPCRCLSYRRPWLGSPRRRHTLLLHRKRERCHANRIGSGPCGCPGSSTGALDEVVTLLLREGGGEVGHERNYGGIQASCRRELGLLGRCEVASDDGCRKESISVLGGRGEDGGVRERRSALEATSATWKGKIGPIFPPAEWLRVPAGQSYNPRLWF
jgi:hypothetical protein